MRLLFGIDSSGAYPPAIHLAANLAFPNPEADLIHVVESVLPDGTFPNLGAEHPLMQIHAQKEEEGRAALDAAEEQLRSAGIPARKFLERGDVARDMIEHADKEKCDLIVARTSHKGYYGSLFFGSVAKGLLIGARQSLLIAKGEDMSSKKLRVVFATDHSPYCDRCVDALAAMAPQGIEHLTVMTANQMNATLATSWLSGWSDYGAASPTWVRETLQERNQDVVERLAPLNAHCDSVIVDGHPNDAIRQVMEGRGADLLIVGAQGHGFLDRLVVGSKSFHQVISEPYSVLVLRPGA